MQALRSARFVCLSRLSYVLLYGELFRRFVGSAEDGCLHDLGGLAHNVCILLVLLDLCLACGALTTELVSYFREESSESSRLFSLILSSSLLYGDVLTLGNERRCICIFCTRAVKARWIHIT